MKGKQRETAKIKENRKIKGAHAMFGVGFNEKENVKKKEK